MSGRSFQSYANTHNISVTVGIYTLEDPVRYEPIMEFVSNVVVVEERSGLSSGCDSHLGLIRRCRDGRNACFIFQAELSGFRGLNLICMMDKVKNCRTEEG